MKKYKLTIKPEKSYAIYHKDAKLMGGFETKEKAEQEKRDYDKSKIERLIEKARKKYI